MKTTTTLCLMLFAIPAALLTPATALADGMGLAPYQYEMYETDQLAIIDHDADSDVEVMHILPMFRGDPIGFAWIVPTPSLPTVAESSSELFRQFESLSAPVYRNRDSFWGCEGSTDYIVGAPGRDNGVVIEFQDIVGIYDVMILSADDAVALADSLTAWGYLHADNTDAVLPMLTAYVDEGWSFTTLRVSDDVFGYGKSSWYGGIEPVAFTFASAEIIYPMRISALSADARTDVVLYVISDHRTTFDGALTRYANRLTADELSGVRSRYAELSDILEAGDFITKLTRTYTPAEMVADLVLEPAPTNDEFKQVNYSGAPVTLGLLVAIGVGLKTLARRRRRR